MSNADMEGLKFTKSIDLSRVDPSDRPYMREILMRVLSFHHPMPKLDPDIYDAGDHYNLALKGWNQEIDDASWYATFLAPTRESTFDRILKTGTLPRDDNDCPVKILRIAKSTYAKSTHSKRK